MKRILSLLLMCCMLASSFALGESPEIENVPDAAPIEAVTDSEEPLSADESESADSQIPEAAMPQEVTEQSDDSELTAKEASAVEAALDRTSVKICPKDTGCVLHVNYSDASSVDSDGTERTAEFSSSNPKCVVVDSTGRLKGIKKGSAVITVKVSFEGKTETLKCTVKVLSAPKKVSISPATAVLELGKTESGTYKISFPSGTAASCTFTSSDESVAVVDAYGKVTAVSEGCAVITAKPYTGSSAVSKLTVWAPASEIIPETAEAITLGKGMTRTLQFTLPDFERDTFTWASSDESVVTVSGEGVITAVDTGEARVTVTAENGGVSADYSVRVEEGPQSLEVLQPVLQLGVGNVLSLIDDGVIQFTPASAPTSLTLKSSKKSVVSVTADGKIKALKAGTAAISVASANGLTAQFTVKVSKYPSSVQLTPKTLTLGEQMTQQLKVSFGKNTYSAVTYSSDHPEIASVDPQTGLVTGVSAGTCVITCKCISGSKKASVKVTVLKAPSSISVKESVITGYPGQSSLAVQGICPDQTLCDFSYSVTSGEAYVSVDGSTGSLTLLGEGSAEITVTAENNPSVQTVCTVNVLPGPTDLSIPEDAVTIGVGNSLNLLSSGTVVPVPKDSATDYTFISSSAKIASVSAAGVVKGLKAGTAKITVTTANGLSKTFPVKVFAYPSSMSISPASLTLNEQMTAQLNVKFGSNTFSLYRFTSQNPSVAEVDAQTGEVTAVGAGTAKIICTCLSGKKSAVCKVTVKAAPTVLTLTPETAVIGVGDSVTVAGTLNNACTEPCTYTSLTPDIAGVDALTGTVTALAEGTAVIRAQSYNGLTQDAQITVIAAPETVSLTAPAVSDGTYQLELRRAETFQLTPDPAPYTALSFTYSVSDSAIASVDQNGLITARSLGTCDVCVTAYNGAQAVIHLTVTTWTSELDPFLIAHALGGINDDTYTNSLEAFQKNYKAGHRIFECDLSITKDGGQVLWHSWSDRICSKTKAGFVPTVSQFKSLKIDDKYTPLSLEDLINLMLKYPDIRVVTDNKYASTAEKQFKQLLSMVTEMHAESILSRFIVQVYDQASFKAVDRLYHFNAYIFTVYRIFTSKPSTASMEKVAAFCAENGIDMITMPYTYCDQAMVNAVNKYGVDVGIHTVDSAKNAKTFLNMGVKAIYTDFLTSV